MDNEWIALTKAVGFICHRRGMQKNMHVVKVNGGPSNNGLRESLIVQSYIRT